jgi:hypothetical protein
VSDPAAGNAFGDFEAPSGQADKGRSGRLAAVWIEAIKLN